MPQGAGPDFGSALEPADDFSRGKIARHLLDQFRLGQSLMRYAGLPEDAGDFCFAVAKPVKGMGQPIASRLPERLVMMPQRASERRAGIRGARRHPNSVIVRVAKDPGIGHAVQRDTAEQAEIAALVPLRQRADDVEDGFLNGVLEREREIAMVGGKRLVLRALRTKGLDKLLLEWTVETVRVA